MAKADSKPEPTGTPRRRSRGKAEAAAELDASSGPYDDLSPSSEAEGHEHPADHESRAPIRSGNGAGAAMVPAGSPGPDAQSPRFRIFVIDTGWNSAAGKVLRANLNVLRDLMPDDPVYVLDHQRSVALLREHRSLIGRDPIIYVDDSWAHKRRRRGGEHGFRLHLGLLRKEDQVLGMLQLFAQFLAQHAQSSDIETQVRRKLHLAGLEGAIEIIAGGEAHGGLVRS